MDRIELEVAQDHIESLAKVRNPLIAVEELIWNGVDADASKIRVALVFNTMGGLEKLTVKDNGTGIPRVLCGRAFGSLGGSPKLEMKTTPAGRSPHGKAGKGRFRAFGIGRTVTWRSRYRANGEVREYAIRGLRATLRQFEIGDEHDSKASETGVEVTVEDIDQNFPSLTNSDSAAHELSRRLALYLKKYPGIRIHYEDHLVDPAPLEDHIATYELTLQDQQEQRVPGELTVIEWKAATERALYLCDEAGFTLDERPPGIQAPGYNFTAYLKSPLVRQLVEENAFSLDTLHPAVESLLETVKEALRTHFRHREAGRSLDLVRRWQQEEIYPYDPAEQGPLKEAERQVFDVCAFKVHEYLPDFQKTESKSKRLTFRLIREALESNPDSLQMILRQVLELPQDQQDELAAILARTRLAAILNAAKTVIGRLDFLASLDALLFGQFKQTLLETRQLHRILTEELWVFGEQYALGVDDQSLRSLLEKHVAILGRDQITPEVGEVTDLEGKERRVDLMLYRQYPQPTPDKFEHLVIELKRPTRRLGKEELGQIEDYAFAVADDERFNKSNTRWTFLLIGNDLAPFATNKCRVQGREYGHIHAADDASVNIHVKTWAGIISQAKWRYEFFRDRLQLEVTTADGLQYLRSQHRKRLPKSAEDADECGHP